VAPLLLLLLLLPGHHPPLLHPPLYATMRLNSPRIVKLYIRLWCWECKNLTQICKGIYHIDWIHFCYSQIFNSFWGTQQ
jgi:hypothetical protein